MGISWKWEGAVWGRAKRRSENRANRIEVVYAPI
jgi:hypothetical protein